MNKRNHRTIHSLVPVYASFSRIVKDAVEGFQGGKYDKFVDIRKEAEDGMANLMMIEKDLACSKFKRRSYDK